MVRLVVKKRLKREVLSDAGSFGFSIYHPRPGVKAGYRAPAPDRPPPDALL